MRGWEILISQGFYVKILAHFLNRLNSTDSRVPRAWHQALGARLGDQGHEPPLHHQVEDPLKSKQLQPHHGNVPPVFEGEIHDHVLPRYRQPQPEERDLLKLQTQKGKVVGKNLSPNLVSHFLITNFNLFGNLG